MPKTYEKKLWIDMDFQEALERFGTTDPKELPDNIKLSKKRKAAPRRPPTKRDETSSR